MAFSDKYTNSSVEAEAHKEKVLVSNDAYAIGEMLDELIGELRRAN
jgi:hypothetical protein